MVSLQVANTAWLCLGNDEELPSSRDYIGTYHLSIPSYQEELQLRDEKITDSQVHDVLSNYETSFSELYQSYLHAYSAEDQYTLFLPTQSPITDKLIESQFHSLRGFSHKDIKFSVEADTQLQALLNRHMVSVKIEPRQIEYRTTRIHTRNHETIDIDQHGYINHSDTKIIQYIQFPHATIFLLNKEIEPFEGTF